MTVPVVAAGDGALGFLAALSDVFPEIREQRCWVHRTANILDSLAKQLHPWAKVAILEIYQAETRADTGTGIDTSPVSTAIRIPKAVAKLTKDWDLLLTF